MSIVSAKRSAQCRFNPRFNPLSPLLAAALRRGARSAFTTVSPSVSGIRCRSAVAAAAALTFASFARRKRR